ncbi:MAG: ribosome maturation factor RimM [Bacteroidaceae bacterium]|nr:ribosome maturation factor RimM [Bacteroidaceae bacterium]
MIVEQELLKVGKFVKTHGVSGELIANFDDAIVSALETVPFFVMQIDGLFVPFFVKSYRARSATSALICFDDIDTVEKAERMCGMDVYLHNRFSDIFEDEDQMSLQMLSGFEIVDKTYGKLGRVINVDDRTVNLLFQVQGEKSEFFLPAADVFIKKIDMKKHVILTDYPQDMPID